MPIKLVSASDVVVKKGKKKDMSSIEIKTSKVPLKIIPKDSQIINDATSNKLSEISTVDTVKTVDNKHMAIRAIKLKQDIYYGPKNINKNKFMGMYKKIGLRWVEYTSIDGEIVNCWINQDRSQYIIKLFEEGEYKRFKFYGCDEIYDYFIGLGAVKFDYTKEKELEPTQLSNFTNKNGGIETSELEEPYRFVGADLWSGYRTRQLLRDMPDNWGVIWK